VERVACSEQNANMDLKLGTILLLSDIQQISSVHIHMYIDTCMHACILPSIYFISTVDLSLLGTFVSAGFSPSKAKLRFCKSSTLECVKCSLQVSTASDRWTLWGPGAGLSEV
jgi:hypothetical protein